MPTNGPLLLKLDAVTPAPDTDFRRVTPTVTTRPPNPGRVTLTVFDDSAPTQGVILDVSFPAETGEASATLELTIQPQKEYRVTVTRSSAEGSGRNYRLGVSHQALRLGQSDQRYLGGTSQNWGIEAGAGETVTLELASDTAADGLAMATSAFVTIVDPATGEVLDGPNTLTFTPGTPQTVTGPEHGGCAPDRRPDRPRRPVPDAPDRWRRDALQSGLFPRGPDSRSRRCHRSRLRSSTPAAPSVMERSRAEAWTCGRGFRARATRQRVEQPAAPSCVSFPGILRRAIWSTSWKERASIAGGQMPRGGPFLTSTEVGLVRGWIRGGAPDTPEN